MDVSLTDLRRKAGFASQEALADILGVRRVTISRWETGAREPSLEYVRRLSSLLSVPADDILSACEKSKNKKKGVQVNAQI